MTNNEMINELKFQLEQEIKNNAELVEQISFIAQRQKRDRAETTVHFAVEVDGEIRHESTNWEAAVQAKEFYDDAKLVSWTSTPVKYVTMSEPEKVEGN